MRVLQSGYSCLNNLWLCIVSKFYAQPFLV
nr:MAG TPA: hypothetical protein [Caudoviricetes sp.]